MGIVSRAYDDIFLHPKKAENRFNDVYAYQWLLSEYDKKARERVFDLAGINQEAIERDISKVYGEISGMIPIPGDRDSEMVDLLSKIIVRNTI